MSVRLVKVGGKRPRGVRIARGGGIRIADVAVHAGIERCAQPGQGAIAGGNRGGSGGFRCHGGWQRAEVHRIVAALRDRSGAVLVRRIDREVGQQRAERVRAAQAFRVAEKDAAVLRGRKPGRDDAVCRRDGLFAVRCGIEQSKRLGCVVVGVHEKVVRQGKAVGKGSAHLAEQRADRGFCQSCLTHH